MKKAKRIFAIIGIVILASLYLSSIISAFLNKPYAKELFFASLFCTITVPILIYAFMIVFKAVHKENGISIQELKKQNKKFKK